MSGRLGSREGWALPVQRAWGTRLHHHGDWTEMVQILRRPLEGIRVLNVNVNVMCAASMSPWPVWGSLG